MANFERKIHRIEDDIRGDWLEDLAEEGVSEIEAFLAKHQAFAVKSIARAKHLNDTEELAYWGLSDADLLDTELQQLAA